MRWTVSSLFGNLRHRAFLARHAAGFGLDYLERGYKIYLNHSKVIHYRGGYPVYSLTSPPLLSKPFANFVARALYRGIQNRPLPSVMSFAVTDRCNANCAHCSFFERIAAADRTCLSTDQCRLLIKQAQQLGVSVIQFLGGEPLLREDLPALLRAVDKDLSTTVLITNGWHLADRVAELKKCGLDSVFVSLDSATAGAHDAQRGLPGLFDRALAGLSKARQLGMSTGISCILTPASFAAGELGRMMALAKHARVHEVLVLEAVPVGRCLPSEGPPASPEWLEELVLQAEVYNADRHLPGVLVYPFVNGWRSAGCSGGASYFYVTPYGDVCPCDMNERAFGNVKESPLPAIWDDMTATPGYGRSHWPGCRMRAGTAERVSEERRPIPV